MGLKDIRENTGLKVWKVAEYLGISRRHYYRIESKQAKLDNAKAEKLSHLFGVSVTEIIKAWEEMN